MTFCAGAMPVACAYESSQALKRHRDVPRALSPRELQVLQLMCMGLVPKRIALRLGIKAKTVTQHRFNIGQKTGCTSAVQLGVWAARQGIA